jgi:O-antigen/teichoic acid export membrane protein
VTAPSLARDSVFNTLSFFVRGVGVVVAMAWIARSLGPENQGRFGFVHWLGAMLAQASVWGLGVTSTRFVAASLGDRDPHAAAQTVRLTTRWLLITLLAVGVAAGAGAWLFGGELRVPLLAAVPMMLTISLYQWRLGVAWGLRRFDIALVGYLVFFTALFSLLPFALSRPDPIPAVLLAFAAARGLHVAVVWVWTQRALRQLVADSASSPEHTERFAELAPSMLRYARQMFVVALFGALLWERTSLPFLKLTADFEQIGFYTAAFGVSVLFLRVPGVLAQVLLPVVAQLEGAGAAPEVLGAMFRRAAKILSVVIIPPVVLLWLGAPWVIELMFGAEYLESTRLLRILLIPLLFAGPGAAGAKTLVGAGQQAQLVKIVATTATLKLLLCGLLIPSYGATGAALAVAVSWSFAMIAEGITASVCFPKGLANGKPTNSGAD